MKHNSLNENQPYQLLTNCLLFLFLNLFIFCTNFLGFTVILLIALPFICTPFHKFFSSSQRHVLQLVRHPQTVSRHVLQAVRHPQTISRHILQAVRHPRTASRHVLQVVRHPQTVSRHVLQPVRHTIEWAKTLFLVLLDTIIGHREANFTFEGGKFGMKTMQKA